MALATTSLQRSQNPLSDPAEQIAVLESRKGEHKDFPAFSAKLAEIGLLPLRPKGVEIFQVNLGKMCNQTCTHCHVDAGPDRTEIMTRGTMEACLVALAQSDIQTVDLTGGAPEMNPDFRWFVEQIRGLGRRVMVRCNLTIITANPKYHDLPTFFKTHQVEVVSSLPFYNADRTDKQRGGGVFESSMKALRMLNEVGYGDPDAGLKLNLVYNPSGAFLPDSQASLKAQFQKVLWDEHAVRFNDLYAITNMPISRYLESLLRTGNYERYMDKLVGAFNPSAALGVMCRNTISVGWDGRLFDCDFNQMLDLEVQDAPSHITAFDVTQLSHRSIVLGQHCYGCTAGAGSSCGGAVA